jgi:broad specificity phosphatase PhoE
MPYLYLVRHGQPDFAGNYDSVTALGAQQSTWLGEHFAARGLQFARVVSGTLQRQVQTCDLMLEAMGSSAEAVRDARFNEYDHASLLAAFAGDRLQALRAAGDRRGYFMAIRDSLYAWSQHDGALADGESWADFGTRIQEGVAALCDGLGRDDNVLIVSSGGVIGRFHGGGTRGRARYRDSAEPADTQYRRNGSRAREFGVAHGDVQRRAASRAPRPRSRRHLLLKGDATLFGGEKGCVPFYRAQTCFTSDTRLRVSMVRAASWICVWYCGAMPRASSSSDANVCFSVAVSIVRPAA